MSAAPNLPPPPINPVPEAGNKGTKGDKSRQRLPSNNLPPPMPSVLPPPLTSSSTPPINVQLPPQLNDPSGQPSNDTTNNTAMKKLPTPLQAGKFPPSPASSDPSSPKLPTPLSSLHSPPSGLPDIPKALGSQTTNTNFHHTNSSSSLHSPQLPAAPSSEDNDSEDMDPETSSQSSRDGKIPGITKIKSKKHTNVSSVPIAPGRESEKASKTKKGKRNKSDGGEADSNESSALGSSWDSVYSEFESKMVSQQNHRHHPDHVHLYSVPAPDASLTLTERITPQVVPSKAPLPFYVQESLKVYADPIKTITYLSEDYGSGFKLKERAQEQTSEFCNAPAPPSSSIVVSTSGSSLPIDPSSPTSPSSPPNSVEKPPISPLSATPLATAKSGSLNRNSGRSTVNRSNSSVVPMIVPQTALPSPTGSPSALPKVGTKPSSGNLNLSGSTGSLPPLEVPMTGTRPSSRSIVADVAPFVGFKDGTTPTQAGLTPRSPSNNQLAPEFFPPSDSATSPSTRQSTTPSLVTSWLKVDEQNRIRERARRNATSSDSIPTVFHGLDASSLLQDTVTTEEDIPTHAIQPLLPYSAPNQLLLRCKNLTFAGNFELVQCTISLHDVEQRVKLTEDFHFDFAEDIEPSILSAVLPDLLGTIDPESKTKRALVPLNNRSVSIYILVRLRVVMKGDIEDAIVPYTSPNRLKKDELQKFIDLTAKGCQTLGKYRQPLAWGALQVFNEQNRLLLHDDSQVKLYKMKPTLDDQMFYDTIASPEKLKLYKQLEGTLSLSGYLYNPEKYLLQSVLDTNLGKYPNFYLISQLTSSAPATSSTAARTTVNETVKEIKEFEQPNHHPQPFATYENNLYLYIKSVNLSSKVKAKHIAVRVYFMKKEGNPETEAAEAIYGTSSTKTLVNCFNTTVDVDEKDGFAFFDEIKIKLPMHLKDHHHLYFQVYKINRKILNPKSKGDLLPETALCHTFLHLFKEKENRFVLANQVHTLDLLTTKSGVHPESYLKDPTSVFSIEEGCSLTFATRLVSSVYTMDESLSSFYKHLQESNLEKACMALRTVPEALILANFASILNHLFSQLFNNNDKANKEKIFMAILDVAVKVSSLTVVGGKISVSEELLKYASCHFDPGQSSENAAVFIAKMWVALLKKSAPSEGGSGGNADEIRLAQASILELAWWLFRLIIRSLGLSLIQNNQINSDANRRQRVEEKFDKSISKIVLIAHNRRRTSLVGFDFFNRILAKFVKDLYRFVDRGFVSQLISLHLSELHKEAKTTVVFRFKFLQFISDYEHYVQLNMPPIVENGQTSLSPRQQQQLQSQALSSIMAIPPFDQSTLRIASWKKHILSGHYINEFRTLLIAGDEAKLTRARSISKFRELIWKHSVDPRYAKNPETLRRLASIYFPLATLAFDYVSTLFGDLANQTSVSISASSNTGAGQSSQQQGPPGGEMRDWVLIVLWILKFADRQALKEWRDQYVEASNPMVVSQRSTGSWHKFFIFLRNAVESFKGFAPSQLHDEIVVIICDVLDHFMQGSEQQLLSLAANTPKAFAALAQVLTALMKTQRSARSAMAILGLLQFYISSYRKVLFTLETTGTICSEICVELFRLFQCQHVKVTGAAMTILYLMIQTNYEETDGDFTRMRINSTVALSNVIKTAGVDCNELLIALEAMVSATDTSNSMLSPSSAQRLSGAGTGAGAGAGSASDVVSSQHSSGSISTGAPTTPRSGASQSTPTGVPPMIPLVLPPIDSTSPKGSSFRNLPKLPAPLHAQVSPLPHSKFTEAVHPLIQKYRQIIRQSIRMENISIEFADQKLEVLYSIAKAYSDCPEIRVQWLAEMAKLNEAIDGWDEAANCRLQIASLVAEYLIHIHPNKANHPYKSFAKRNSTYDRVVPDLIQWEEPLGQTGRIISSHFTEDSLLGFISDASANFTKGDKFESATDVLTMYFQLCMDTRRYANIALYSGNMQELSGKAEKANRAQSRITPNFYRAGFYGKGFADDNGKEFVYKVPPSVRLADFTEQIVARYKQSIGTVDVLNNKPISYQTLDPAKNYVQIVNLEPYFDNNMDSSHDLTFVDRTRNIRKFYYETAYNPDGGRPSEDVSKMYKRRDIITASMAFPNFFRRVQIASKETQILQPIDCAYDLIVTLTSKLKTALNCVPLVAKNLQIILQGAVMAQVNAGPAAIIAHFLSRQHDFPPEMVDKLKEGLKTFIRTCSFGLKFNEKLTADQPETAGLQEAMMESFGNLQKEASKYVDLQI